MPIIDDKGRLFGKLNIIDAAVAVLIIVLIVAGAQFLIDDPETVEVQAQIEATDVPREDAGSLSIGDELADGSITITDLRVIPLSQDTSRVFAKVAIRGEKVDSGVKHGQDIVRPGAEIPLSLGGTTVSTTVVLVDDRDELVYLQRPTEVVVVAEDQPLPIRFPDDPGTVGQLGEAFLFEPEGHLIAPSSGGSTGSSSRSAADVYTWGSMFRLSSLQGGSGALLASGSQTSLQLPGLVLDARLQSVPGLQEIPVTRTNTTVRLSVPSGEGPVPPSIPVGAVEIRDGREIARVQEVVQLDGRALGSSQQSSLSFSTSPGASGESAPRFWVDVSVEAVDVLGSLEYKGQPLEPSRDLTFSSSGVSFTGRILSLEPRELSTGSAQAEVVVHSVPNWIQRVVDPGVEERTGSGDVIASVSSVTTTPSLVFITYQDRIVVDEHPELVDLRMNVTLAMGADGRYKDADLVPGSELFLRLGGIPLEAVVFEVSR